MSTASAEESPSQLPLPYSTTAAEKSQPAASAPPVPLGARILAIAVCALLAWHFLATATWNSAPNAVRATIGQQNLQAWMIPLFGQSWSVFAPNPGSVNQSLEVRAQIGDTTTEWYSLTTRSAEHDVQGHLVPSRMYLNDFILADRFYDAALELPLAVRDRAGADLENDEWWLALEEDLRAASSTDIDSKIESFLRYERTAMGLVSEVAIARWGSEVTAVQVRVVMTPVVRFAERGTDAETKVTSFTDGWRPPLRVEGIDTTVFDSMFAEEGAP